MVRAIVLGVLLALVCSSGSLAQSSSSEDIAIECSCSPTFFQFTITLDQEPPCTNNDIKSNAGIATSDTICFKECGLVEGITTADLPVPFNDFGPVPNITSMYFKEFNSQGIELTSSSVTYDSISLVNGQIISFASASASLDPDLSLQDQIDQVPVSVEINMFGPNPDPDDELCPEISNKLTWTYDMSCGSRPIQTGDNIGWIDMGVLANPLSQFCPTPPPSPSPTISMSYGYKFGKGSKNKLIMSKSKSKSKNGQT